MPRRVFLHIGLPKTGTTAVQELLWHNRNTIAARGIRVPGPVQSAQYHAAIDLQRERYRDWLEPMSAGAWDRLVGEIRGWPGTSVVSCELLATATSKQVDRVRSSLDFAEVHVVCTARDLARQIPSVWQENVKTGQTTTLADLLAALRTGEPVETSGLFWDYQDLTQILRTWSSGLPPERVHVVTVPRSGPGVWPRFASVLGLDTSNLVPHGGDNRSLGAVEAELLRRLNGTLRVDWPHYAAVVKELLALEILGERAASRRISLPAGEYPWVRKQAEQFVDEIREARYHVVGELDELVPAEPATTAPSVVPEGELLDAAMDALAALVPRVPKSPESGPLKGFLLGLSDRHSSVMALRRLYWRGKARVGRDRE